MASGGGPQLAYVALSVQAELAANESSGAEVCPRAFLGLGGTTGASFLLLVGEYCRGVKWLMWSLFSSLITESDCAVMIMLVPLSFALKKGSQS